MHHPAITAGPDGLITNQDQEFRPHIPPRSRRVPRNLERAALGSPCSQRCRRRQRASGSRSRERSRSTKTSNCLTPHCCRSRHIRLSSPDSFRGGRDLRGGEKSDRHSGTITRPRSRIGLWSEMKECSSERILIVLGTGSGRYHAVCGCFAAFGLADVDCAYRGTAEVEFFT